MKTGTKPLTKKFFFTLAKSIDLMDVFVRKSQTARVLSSLNDTK